MAVLKGLAGELSGQVIDLQGGGTDIGRDESGHLVLSDASVSSRHARMWRESKWLVEDLGSRNKTLLNGAELEAHEVFELQDGDKLSFGNVITQFDSTTENGAMAEARAALDAAGAQLERMHLDAAALRDHIGKQDAAIKSRDDALAQWEQRMHEVNASWVSRDELDKERARIRAELEAEAQKQIDAAVRRYNEMESRYVQVSAKLETAERAVKEKDEQIRFLNERLRR
jgi:hypothetical protein